MPTKTKKVAEGIWLLDDGRYWAVRTWTCPRTGRRIRREATKETHGAAADWRDSVRAEESSEPTSRPLFGAYAVEWFKVHRANLRASTRQRYGENLERWIGELGHVYLDALRPMDIKRYVAAHRETHANATINGWLRVLRLVLSSAVADGVAPRNVAEAVKYLPKPKRTKGRRGVRLSVSQFAALLATVPTMTRTPRDANGQPRKAEKGKPAPTPPAYAEDIKRLIVVACWTGARAGELLALRWTDIADGEIKLERAVWNGHEGATKTDDPRIVPLAPDAADALDEQRRWLIAEQHKGLASGLCFPATLAGAKAGATRRKAKELRWYRQSSVLRQPLHDLCEQAGVPVLSWHALRRNAENLQRAAGVDAHVRRGIMGWRREEVQALYAEVDAGERKAAVAAMVDLVRRAG